jgi:hypothetical protein
MESNGAREANVADFHLLDTFTAGKAISKKPTFSGRFHHWLSATQSDQLQVAVHRPLTYTKLL